MPVSTHTGAPKAAFWRPADEKNERLDQFESPTPIQGKQKIDGIVLAEVVLRKLYFDNATRVLRWKPRAGPVAPGTGAASGTPGR